MQTVGLVIELVLFLFLLLLFARFIVDWVQVFARSWQPKGVVLVILEVIYSITDPPILFIRRFVPPLRHRVDLARHQLHPGADRGLHPARGQPAPFSSRPDLDLAPRAERLAVRCARPCRPRKVISCP